MFAGEHGIALHAMLGNRASFHGEWDVSWSFSSCGWNLDIFSSYKGDGHPMLVWLHQDSCIVVRDTTGFSTRLLRAIWTLLEERWETKGHFLFFTVILGFLSIFKKSQASSPFEAWNSACLSRCQRDVRPPVQMRRGHGAFSKLCTGYSDIPSPCEMKDEPSLKPLQGNLAFFRVRGSHCPFHWRHKFRVPLTYLVLREGSS